MSKYNRTIGLGLSGLLAAISPLVLDYLGVIKNVIWVYDESALIYVGLFFGFFIALYSLIFGLIKGGWFTKLLRLLFWLIIISLVNAGAVFLSMFFGILGLGMFAPILIGGIFGGGLTLLSFRIIYPPLTLKSKNWLTILTLSVGLTFFTINYGWLLKEPQDAHFFYLVLVWQTGIAASIGRIIDKTESNIV